MGRQSRKKKAKRNEPHPTLFVLEGAIQYFPDGSMLELYTQIKPDEWKEIIIGTIQYKIFIQCLKEVAFPILHEVWTKEDEWFLVMLDHNLGRMKNLDPLLFISIDQESIKSAFEAKISTNAAEVAVDIKRMREQQNSWLGDRSDHTNTDVSEL